MCAELKTNGESYSCDISYSILWDRYLKRNWELTAWKGPLIIVIRELLKVCLLTWMTGGVKYCLTTQIVGFLNKTQKKKPVILIHDQSTRQSSWKSSIDWVLSRCGEILDLAKWYAFHICCMYFCGDLLEFSNFRCLL